MKIQIKVLACLVIFFWEAQITAQETAGSSAATGIVISSAEAEVYPLNFLWGTFWAGSALMDPGNVRTPFLLYSYKVCASEGTDAGDCLDDTAIAKALAEVARHAARAAILDPSTGKAQAIVITGFKKAQGIMVSDANYIQAFQAGWRDALAGISRNGNGASAGMTIAFTRPLKSTFASLSAEKFIVPRTLWAASARN